MFVQLPVMTYDDYSKAWRNDGNRIVALANVGMIEPTVVPVGHAAAHTRLCSVKLEDGRTLIVGTTFESLSDAMAEQIIVHVPG